MKQKQKQNGDESEKLDQVTVLHVRRSQFTAYCGYLNL